MAGRRSGLPRSRTAGPLHSRSGGGDPMKTAVLFGLTALVAMPAFAQTGAPAADHTGQDQAREQTKVVTLTGCVGGGSQTNPITLSDAMIVPGTPQPGQIDQTPSPIPPPVSAEPTEPG